MTATAASLAIVTLLASMYATDIALWALGEWQYRRAMRASSARVRAQLATTLGGWQPEGR